MSLIPQWASLGPVHASLEKVSIFVFIYRRMMHNTWLSAGAVSEGGRERNQRRRMGSWRSHAEVLRTPSIIQYIYKRHRLTILFFPSLEPVHNTHHSVYTCMSKRTRCIISLCVYSSIRLIPSVSYCLLLQLSSFCLCSVIRFIHVLSIVSSFFRTHWN